MLSQLRKAHPNEPIPSPPVKDRSTVSSQSTPSPLSPTPSFQSTNSPSYESNALLSPSSHQSTVPSRLAREKNRLTLRAYLHSLLSSSTIASSPVLKSFLLSGPTTLSREELDDAHRREEADKVREDGRKRFAMEIASRVNGLRDAVKGVKGDIMGKGNFNSSIGLFVYLIFIDGLTQIFGTIKVTPNVHDLPPDYQAVLEWARISSVLFYLFLRMVE